jgi:hypothetical protein
VARMNAKKWREWLQKALSAESAPKVKDEQLVTPPSPRPEPEPEAKIDARPTVLHDWGRYRLVKSAFPGWVVLEKHCKDAMGCGSWVTIKKVHLEAGWLDKAGWLELEHFLAHLAVTPSNYDPDRW